MARSLVTTSDLPRPVLLSSMGLLARHIPPGTVWEVLTRHGRHSRRERLLPAPFLVYLVVALSLYMPYALREVLRCVVEGLRSLDFPGVPQTVIATKAAISHARIRLGWEVMGELFDRVARPLATPKTPGAWYRGWRLVAVDGVSLAVPYTEANAAAFGLHASGNGEGAFPLVRLATLVEVGTHGVFRAAMDAYGRSESSIAEELLPGLGPEMLLIEDRGFVGYEWWKKTRATGAEVLCRVRSNMRFPCHERLEDGSYLSVLRPPKSIQEGPIAVRVIAYTLEGVSGADPVYRVVTSLLDPEAAPATELAALYHERWESETTFDEFKTHLRGGAQVVLRSKTPDLVRQEVYGLLLAHYAVRAVMHDAALVAGEDPDRISFIHTVRVLRRKLPQAANFPPSAAESLVSESPDGGAGGARRLKPGPKRPPRNPPSRQ